MSQQSFAAAMTDLEEVVRKLEQGDVPLEEAIDLYKKGYRFTEITRETGVSFHMAKKLLVEEGIHEELMDKNGKYAYLYQMQFKV